MKLKYVEEYKAGKHIELPHNFRGDWYNFIHIVRDWVKIFDLYGVMSELDEDYLLPEEV